MVSIKLHTPLSLNFQAKVDYLSTLPDEIISKIVSLFLEQENGSIRALATTCKRFATIIRTSSTLKNQKIFFGALMTSIKNNRPDILQSQLKIPCFNPTLNENHAIQLAAALGREKIVQILLNNQANPAVNNYYPLQIAASKGHVKTVQILLNDGRSNPTDNDHYARKIANLHGHQTVVKKITLSPAFRNWT